MQTSDALALLGYEGDGLVEFGKLDISYLSALRWHYAKLGLHQAGLLVELRLSHLHECVDDTLLGFVEVYGYHTASRNCGSRRELQRQFTGLGQFDKVKETIKVPTSLCNKLDDKFGEALSNCCSSTRWSWSTHLY